MPDPTNLRRTDPCGCAYDQNGARMIWCGAVHPDPGTTEKTTDTEAHDA